jgi:hypothetical protein
MAVRSGRGSPDGSALLHWPRHASRPALGERMRRAGVGTVPLASLTAASLTGYSPLGCRSAATEVDRGHAGIAAQHAGCPARPAVRLVSRGGPSGCSSAIFALPCLPQLEQAGLVAGQVEPNYLGALGGRYA